MKTATVFIAVDGRRFDDFDECAAYELLAIAVNEAMLPLGPIRRISSNEFVQHSRNAVFQARRSLVVIARTKYDPSRYPVFANDPDTIHPMSAAGRILADCGGCLGAAWARLSNINFNNYREYEQPFFAINPEQAPK